MNHIRYMGNYASVGFFLCAVQRPGTMCTSRLPDHFVPSSWNYLFPIRYCHRLNRISYKGKQTSFVADHAEESRLVTKHFSVPCDLNHDWDHLGDRHPIQEQLLLPCSTVRVHIDVHSQIYNPGLSEKDLDKSCGWLLAHPWQQHPLGVQTWGRWQFTLDAGYDIWFGTT